MWHGGSALDFTPTVLRHCDPMSESIARVKLNPGIPPPLESITTLLKSSTSKFCYASTTKPEGYIPEEEKMSVDTSNTMTTYPSASGESGLRDLYPEIEPYKTGTLKVDDVHEIYYELSGNPSGKPILFVHGGPGGGTAPSNRRFFDPELYNIILFDQRGCGKSKPHASLHNNTTWHLVSDMEKLRETLGIEKWTLFGGSWGSTLSLAYAETHPDRVTELILRGIFTLRKSEIDWFYQEGASHIYPDAWEQYRDAIPEAEREDMVKAYYQRLTSSDPEVQKSAAKAWSVWEGATSKLYTDPGFLGKFQDDEFSLAFARIECHFFSNTGFFDSDAWLLENVDKIRHIPTVIVQGRYDLVCPMRTAWDLHRAFPEAEFTIIQDAGHSAMEPGTRSELIKACDKFGRR
eukprot:gb/GECG01015556.1/.p1 GENE.gb/GECG01015556.1/~~gb/GECG01015556.1/.p1  ORF type:complete len:405 (+),score=49.78 gb/GECG01015556.1/:1-1215(+)